LPCADSAAAGGFFLFDVDHFGVTRLVNNGELPTVLTTVPERADETEDPSETLREIPREYPSESPTELDCKIHSESITGTMTVLPILVAETGLSNQEETLLEILFVESYGNLNDDGCDPFEMQVMNVKIIEERVANIDGNTVTWNTILFEGSGTQCGGPDDLNLFGNYLEWDRNLAADYMCLHSKAIFRRICCLLLLTSRLYLVPTAY
jgi:hypothetical protein